MSGDTISSSRCQPNAFGVINSDQHGKSSHPRVPQLCVLPPSSPFQLYAVFTGAQKQEKNRNELHSKFLEEKAIKGQEAPVAPSCKTGPIGSMGWERWPTGHRAGHWSFPDFPGKDGPEYPPVCPRKVPALWCGMGGVEVALSHSSLSFPPVLGCPCGRGAGHPKKRCWPLSLGCPALFPGGGSLAAPMGITNLCWGWELCWGRGCSWCPEMWLLLCDRGFLPAGLGEHPPWAQPHTAHPQLLPGSIRYRHVPYCCP